MDLTARATRNLCQSTGVPLLLSHAHASALDLRAALYGTDRKTYQQHRMQGYCKPVAAKTGIQNRIRAMLLHPGDGVHADFRGCKIIDIVRISYPSRIEGYREQSAK